MLSLTFLDPLCLGDQCLKGEKQKANTHTTVFFHVSQVFFSVVVVLLTFFSGFAMFTNENNDNDDYQKGDYASRDHSHNDDDIDPAHGLQKAKTLHVKFTGKACSHRIIGLTNVSTEIGFTGVQSQVRGQTIDGEIIQDFRVVATPPKSDLSGVGRGCAGQHDLALRFTLEDRALRLI